MHGHSKKFDPGRMAHLESKERRAVLDPDAILERFNVPRGAVAADIGCGPGVFTLPLAGIVGEEGRVYGIDLEPRMIRRLEERIKETGVRNIIPVRSSEGSIPLPDVSVDFALLVTVLHELEGLATLEEARRILRQTGTLGVVDWKKNVEPTGPPVWHRLSEEEAARLLAKAGFEPGKAFSLGKSHYGFMASRT